MMIVKNIGDGGLNQPCMIFLQTSERYYLVKMPPNVEHKTHFAHTKSNLRYLFLNVYILKETLEFLLYSRIVPKYIIRKTAV